jgi:hypothetical protein
MGPVTDTQTAPANGAHRHSDGLDQRGATEVERRGQGDQVIGGDGHEVGGTAIDVDPDEAEPLANLGAVAAASPTSAARKQRVDEHRCAGLEIRGRTCQAADYLMAKHEARVGTGVLAMGDVEVSAADTHVSWLDQYPARRMYRRGHLRRLDQVSPSPNQCLHSLSPTFMFLDRCEDFTHGSPRLLGPQGTPRVAGETSVDVAL